MGRGNFNNPQMNMMGGFNGGGMGGNFNNNMMGGFNNAMGGFNNRGGMMGNNMRGGFQNNRGRGGMMMPNMNMGMNNMGNMGMNNMSGMNNMGAMGAMGMGNMNMGKYENVSNKQLMLTCNRRFQQQYARRTLQPRLLRQRRCSKWYIIGWWQHVAYWQPARC
jgi:hypothetical protein